MKKEIFILIALSFSLYCFSEPGEFTEKEKSVVKPQISESIYQWKDKCILVVEDVASNFELIYEMINETHAKVIRSNNGIDAIEKIRSFPEINLVLMDIQLPLLNGYDATKQIKAIRPELKVIAQTAYGLAGDREKALSMGCADYIAKPILKEPLLMIIDKYIKN